jgi:HlyD family secretion protein
VKRRIILGGAAALVLAVLIAANVRRARSEAVSVEIARIGQKELVAKVSGSGRIEARKSVSVTANVIGKVTEVTVQEGDVVAKGQLILTIDPGEKRAIRMQAEAEVARAKAREDLEKAELRQTEMDLERTRGLVKEGLASQNDLEQKTTEREVRAASLAAAREELRNAQATLDYAGRELQKTEVRAEIPGVVVRLGVEEGENVLAGDLYNPGSSIVEIADLSEMEAHILVDETEVVHVKKGQKAEIKVDAFPNLTLTGTVSEVGNSAYNPGALGSQESKDFRVKILLDPSSVTDLRPGLSVSAKIETDRRPQALAVPIEALTIRDPRREEEKLREKLGEKAEAKADSAQASVEKDEGGGGEEKEGVFIVEEGRARFVPIETGIAGEKDFEVLAGLQPGQELVRGPFDALRKLESGQKVKRAKRDRESENGADAAGEASASQDGES